MNLTFGMCEAILILSFLFYSSSETISLVLLSLGIIGGIIRYCVSLSNTDELRVLNKRVIMSEEERSNVLAKLKRRP